ncbi:MAG TPA: hypothetical protein VFD84_17650 [Candidatus Binatia bacterium]|jgi:uncharacterized membrane protein|nr:hypothetical protein [Candidatus Binatia bacterium]
MRTSRGLLIASAAASLVIGGAIVARADQKKGGDEVQCLGVNACKGQGSCAGAGNSCAGQNACKGKGIVHMSAEECAKKGGRVVGEKKDM